MRDKGCLNTRLNMNNIERLEKMQPEAAFLIVLKYHTG